jgi:hypothetical protein
MAENVSFKVSLKDAGENEVRRFVVDRDVSTSFTYLQEKLCAVFPQLSLSFSGQMRMGTLLPLAWMKSSSLLSQKCLDQFTSWL